MTELDKCVTIRGTGSYLPNNIVLNEQLEIPAARAKLIEEKTGVRSRRYADDDESTSDLAYYAALDCLRKSDVKAEEVDAIILATSSPDRIHPATATRLQALLKATNAFAFDINSVCSGNIYAMTLAESLIRSGKCRYVLVVAAEIYSRFLNKSDFSTYPYFGDGAGAVLLSESTGPSKGILHTCLKTDGTGDCTIQVPAGGTMKPGWAVSNSNEFYFHMKGKEVFEFAIEKGSQAVLEALDATNIKAGDVACVIAHQANINILAKLADNTGIEFERFFVNLDKYGNTAGASVLIAFDEAVQKGKVRRGEYIMLVAFGGGLSWGSILMQF